VSRRAPIARAVVAALLAGVTVRTATAAPAAAPAAVTVPTSPSALPRVPPPADLPRDRPLRAGFLLVDGVRATELFATLAVLQHSVEQVRPGIDAFTISADGNPARTAEGASVAAKFAFTSAPSLDILVIPGGAHAMDSDLGNEQLVAWLTAAGGKARYVLALRDGVFLAARAGLLQGRLATTFPDDQDRFAQMFPKQELRRGVSFVHDGHDLTSIGGARSYDAALYLVDHLFGEAVARGVAKQLVLPWPPDAEEPALPALVIRYNQVPK